MNYRGTRFWHTAICESVNKTLSRRFIAETTTYKRGFSITLLKPEGISVSPWVELVISSPRFYHWISLTSWLLDSPTWNHVTLVRFSCFPLWMLLQFIQMNKSTSNPKNMYLALGCSQHFLEISRLVLPSPILSRKWLAWPVKCGVGKYVLSYQCG